MLLTLGTKGHNLKQWKTGNVGIVPKLSYRLLCNLTTFEKNYWSAVK